MEIFVVNRRLHSEPRSMSVIGMFHQLRRLGAVVVCRWIDLVRVM